MSDQKDTTESTHETSLSRSMVETICILLAVDRGCSKDDLLERLGLSPSLANIVDIAIDALVSAGSLRVDEQEVHVTRRGAALVAKWHRPQADLSAAE